MPVLLIIGAGGHGKSVADAALESKQWDEIIFLDDSWPGKLSSGHWAISGNTELLSVWKLRCDGAVVAIGNNHLRMELQSRLIAAGIAIVTIVHPSACVSRFATLGSGSVVLANAVVNIDAKVGDAAIIGPAAVIDHDCKLGRGVHIATGAKVGGGVAVGDYTWIGIGAAVGHYLNIGDEVKIAAGTVVTSNVTDKLAVL
jgi:sugar O-acyltransferase (sialic acid O-acetyltransferase NeuD family)